jgi:hypothetical protein
MLQVQLAAQIGTAETRENECGGPRRNANALEKITSEIGGNIIPLALSLQT